MGNQLPYMERNHEMFGYWVKQIREKIIKEKEDWHKLQICSALQVTFVTSFLVTNMCTMR